MKKLTKTPNSLNIEEKKQVESFLVNFLNTEQQISSLSILSLLNGNLKDTLLIILKDKKILRGIFALRGNLACFVGEETVFARYCHDTSYLPTNRMIRLTEPQFDYYCKKHLQNECDKVKVNYYYLEKEKFLQNNRENFSNIRFAKKSDIPLLNKFYNRDYSYRKDFINDDYWAIMVEDERIVSAAKINDSYKKFAIIGAVKTAFLHLNKGYSTLVLSFLIKKLLDYNFEHITLESLAMNPPAIRVYNKVGFTVRGKHYLIEKKPKFLKRYREEILETASWKKF